MPPVQSPYDVGNEHLIDAVTTRESALRDTATRVRRTNLAHRCFGQFRLTMRFADRVDAAALSSHIRVVVGRRPEKQMIRIDAAAIVTTVADGQPGGDGSVRELPCEAVRTSRPSAAPRRAPISVRPDVARPVPAAARVALATLEEWVILPRPHLAVSFRLIPLICLACSSFVACMARRRRAAPFFFCHRRLTRFTASAHFRQWCLVPFTPRSRLQRTHRPCAISFCFPASGLPSSRIAVVSTSSLFTGGGGAPSRKEWPLTHSSTAKSAPSTIRVS